MERFNAAFDGGSRGNPGPAAWGVVVFDEADGASEGFAGSLGKATNNVAEYHGLIETVRLAVERGAHHAVVRSDSELIVRQLEGRYRVRHPDLKPLFAEAQRWIARLERFEIRHVRRELNRDADRMVNLALDRLAAEPDGEPFRLHRDLAAEAAAS